nr:zinc finger BED domain-containing protein RICESLEEPER 2-like [Tanacetum cinerariifolium]
MMKRLIAFEDFSVSHMGDALARMLRKVFVNLNLKDKIMSITLDNARNNTSAIGKLKLKYEPPMDGRFYHSRCVTHIINLVVQDGLAMLAINAIKESFKTMLKDVFNSGGKNHQRYIKIGAIAGKPCLSPKWDVLTRWNSTYHMFQCCLKQRSTLMYFHDLLASKEMCMCLKDHLDTQERKKDKFGLKNPVDFEEEILDAKVQQIEAIPLSDEEIALDAATCKGTMFGLSLGGEEVDYDMTNYGDDY